jgi:hypothetical protein
VDSCDIHIVEVIIDIGLCNSAIVSGGMKWSNKENGIND